MPEAAGGCLAPLMIVVFSWFLFREGRDPERAFRRVGEMVLGMIYIGMLVFVALLKRDGAGEGTAWVLLLLAAVWAQDTAIYLLWLALGGHQDYPDLGSSMRGRLARLVRHFPLPKEISPNKYWSYLVPGMAACLLVNWIGMRVFFPRVPGMQILLFSILVGFASRLGDFCESMLKRARGVKDSGPFFPGHGGMLDRIDTMLFAAPLYYSFFRFFAQ
jgi:phosphatidate cytidylyltransferase